MTEVSQKNSNIFVILCSRENFVRLLYSCYRVPQFADSAIRGFLAGYFNRELRDPPVFVLHWHHTKRHKWWIYCKSKLREKNELETSLAISASSRQFRKPKLYVNRLSTKHLDRQTYYGFYEIDLFYAEDSGLSLSSTRAELQFTVFILCFFLWCIKLDESTPLQSQYSQG